MSTIKQIPVSSFDEFGVRLPSEAMFLSIHIQCVGPTMQPTGLPMMCWEVDDGFDPIQRSFKVYGVNEELDPFEHKFLGSFQTASNIWHLYEVWK